MFSLNCVFMSESRFIVCLQFLFIYDKCPDMHYDVPDLAIYCDINLILHTNSDSVIIQTLLSVICCSQILRAQYAVSLVYRKCQITFRVSSQSTIRIEHDNMGNLIVTKFTNCNIPRDFISVKTPAPR